MEFGYLSIGEPKHSGSQVSQIVPDRANLARSLGFTEFYIPGKHVQAAEYQGGHELMSELILLDEPSTPPSLAPAKLAIGEADIQIFNRPRSLPISPLASTRLVRSHSRLDRLIMSASWLSCEQIACHWQAKVIGNTHAGVPARTKDWRIARSILVCESTEQAEEAVMGTNSPCRDYYRRVAPHMSNTQIDILLDQTVLRGTPEQVVEQLETFIDNVGEFGTLCLVDHAWPDAAMARRSISLLANLVKPELSHNSKIRLAQV